LRQKDIYYAKLDPVTGSEQRGLRPVVIISGNAMNDNLDICIVCPLTTSIKRYSGCVVLKNDSTNNLRQDSEVLTFQVRAISKERFAKQIGEITDEQLKMIIEGLNDILKY
jgi:mRNA interferase MazF